MLQSQSIYLQKKKKKIHVNLLQQLNILLCECVCACVCVHPCVLCCCAGGVFCQPFCPRLMHNIIRACHKNGHPLTVFTACPSVGVFAQTQRKCLSNFVLFSSCQRNRRQNECRCTCARSDLRGTAVCWELTHCHSQEYNRGQEEQMSKTQRGTHRDKREWWLGFNRDQERENGEVKRKKKSQPKTKQR